MQMTDAGDELGTTPSVEPVPARRVVDELIEAGVFDELLERIDERGLQLTGEGGFLPEMIKAVLQRGLQAGLTDHLGYERGDRAGRGRRTPATGRPRRRWPPRSATSGWPRRGIGSAASRTQRVEPGAGSDEQQQSEGQTGQPATGSQRWMTAIERRPASR
jgi:hypothetical protein